MALLLAPLAALNWSGDVRGELPKFLGAGAFVALGEHATAVAFSLLPASIASPIINVQAVIALLLSGILLREEAFALRLLAAALAAHGVTLIGL